MEDVDTSFPQTATNNVNWTDAVDVNLNAAHVDTFLHDWDNIDSAYSQDDIFYDCDHSKLTLDEGHPIQSLVRECCTIFDISSVTAPSAPTYIVTSADCGVIRNSSKPSLHILIYVGDRKFWALVDTGAAATFI